jgi:mono/diheme cytochrome c family protein
MYRKLGFAAVAALCIASLALAQKRAAVPEDARLIGSLKGVDLFHAYCATCHGNDAKGQGPMAQALKSVPADLTKISARNAGKFPFLKVQQMISGQSPVVVSHGNREMPVWGPVFSQVADDQDFGSLRVYNLTQYLESLQK